MSERDDLAADMAADADLYDEPAERLDLTGRDPATLTPIELLAYAYPDVYALMRERDEAQAAIRRVQDLCASARPGRPTLAPSVFVADVLRELDGPEPA